MGFENAHENERIHELIVVRARHNEDRPMLGDSLRAARVELSKENVQAKTKDPEAKVIDHGRHGLLLFRQPWPAISHVCVRVSDAV
jgi:hypothetical protein